MTRVDVRFVFLMAVIGIEKVKEKVRDMPEYTHQTRSDRTVAETLYYSYSSGDRHREKCHIRDLGTFGELDSGAGITSPVQ